MINQNLNSHHKDPGRSYVLAFLMCVLAGVLTLWITPDDHRHYFQIFQAAVVVAAWYGGVGPGILAATASFLIIDYFFLPPINAFVMGPDDFLRLGIFEAVAILTSILSGKLKRTNAALKSMHNELEIRIQERTEDLSQANQKLMGEITQRMEAEKAILEISSREQRRLGQELHDGLCQTLAGIRLIVADLNEKRWDSTTDRTHDFALIDSRLSEALAQADAISRGLYPVELEKNGLMSALEALAEKMSKIYSVECRFRCWEPIEIHDTAVANHIYRIAQESIMNGIKGGKAARINLSFLRQGSKIYLRVTDNGVGLHNSTKRDGMGMQIMKYRARVINADLNFRSGSKGGTVVSCSWPANELPEEMYG